MWKTSPSKRCQTSHSRTEVEEVGLAKAQCQQRSRAWPQSWGWPSHCTAERTAISDLSGLRRERWRIFVVVNVLSIVGGLNLLHFARYGHAVRLKTATLGFSGWGLQLWQISVRVAVNVLTVQELALSPLHRFKRAAQQWAVSVECRSWGQLWLWHSAEFATLSERPVGLGCTG